MNHCCLIYFFLSFFLFLLFFYSFILSFFLSFILSVGQMMTYQQVNNLPTFSVSFFFRPVRYRYRDPGDTEWYMVSVSSRSFNLLTLMSLSIVKIPGLSHISLCFFLFLLSLYRTEPWSQSHLVQDVDFMTCSVTYDILCLMLLCLTEKADEATHVIFDVW